MPLGKNADAGDYVKDFQKSKAPQFKGKSKEKRRKMAIAAYLDAKDKKESKMKSFDDLRNEAANPAQQAAIAINMKKRGVKPKSEDQVFGSSAQQARAMQKRMNALKKKAQKKLKTSDVDEQMTPAQRAKAMADFKKRGGKVTKLPPGKAQGYHGKDDPGRDVSGIMKKTDTKAFGTRKKVRSLGSSMKGMKNMGDMGRMDEKDTYKVQVTGSDHAGVHSVKAKSSDHAHQMVMKKIGQSKLPKHMQPKTRIQKENYKYDYGSPESIKLMKKITPGQDPKVDELAMYTSKKLPNLSYPKNKTKHDKEKARLDMLRKNKRKSESARDDRLAALKKQHDRQKKQDDANLSKLRYARGMKEATNFAVSIEGLPDMFMTADSPGMLKQTLRKIVKQPSMIQSVKRVTDAMVKKTFRLKAQGRDEESEE